ncbi:FixH family protein [Pseudoxanthomonas wuyuanensis]|uniref:Nitrogen fixation protein FixH n=1 Tax=Pseudoxanthomonas wuyuanensis TaxID=1073196 RepID=A0A286DGL4_9GAMM|nr:FixH family protein [Pseudoxanthomonas wuyuanensis]KAF1717206.1 nitrogen fixation protein FixH [Pseudoxanthomonas wuyuanensis]SOD57877.1 hypothetical protein SAMN06296416_1196 [Pseudoxanthomonas wuyuanensis]
MNQQKKWWREPMIWLVAGLPLASIVAGVGLVVIAVNSGGADTVTDRVQRVAQIQTADLGPDQQAAGMKLSAVMRADDGVIEVLPVSGEFPRDQPLSLRLTHPAQAKADLQLELAPTATGWRLGTELDSSHDWGLELAPADNRWRLRGRLPRMQHAAHLAPSLAAAR